MPGVDGHNMTTIEDAPANAAPDAGQEENVDELENETNEETVDAESDQEAKPDAEPGAGDQNAGGEGEETGEEESAVDAEDSGTESGDPQENDGLDLDAFKQDLVKEVVAAVKGGNEPKPVQEPTEEEWVKHEESWGIPRTAIKQVLSTQVKIRNQILDHIDERFAAIESESALRSLARKPGFADAMSLKDGVKQYLSQFNSKLHSNPKILQTAVIFARGLAASKNLQKVRAGQERNVKIAGKARPAASNAVGRKPAPKGLTPVQKDVAAKFGMSEAEYSKLMGGSRTIAA